MIAVITALFFACAAAFAVFTISQAFAGSAERLDALFAQYRALGDARTISGQMRPVAQFTAAPAPTFARCNILSMPIRAAGDARISRSNWRAAA